MLFTSQIVWKAIKHQFSEVDDVIMKYKETFTTLKVILTQNTIQQINVQTVNIMQKIAHLCMYSYDCQVTNS